MTQAGKSIKLIWFDGKLIPYEDAKIHVMSTCARYGTNVFEGIRAYWNDKKKELYCFRLEDHYVRLQESMRVMDLQTPYSAEDNIRFLLETLRENNVCQDAHIRHQVLVSGIGPSTTCEPVSMFIAVALRAGESDNSIKCCVSSWTRISDNSMPPRVKAGSNYQNSRFAKLWAKKTGNDDAIMLNERGKVSESTASCFFMVRKGVLVTPSKTHNILEGVTRATVMKLAEKDLNIKIEEREIDRSELYVAEEAFLCGSAIEIAPINEIDGFILGSTGDNSVTQRIRQCFFQAVRGNKPEYLGWLTPVYGK